MGARVVVSAMRVRVGAAEVESGTATVGLLAWRVEATVEAGAVSVAEPMVVGLASQKQKRQPLASLS